MSSDTTARAPMARSIAVIHHDGSGSGSHSTRSIAIDVLRGLAIVVMVFVDLPGRYSAKAQPLQHTEWAGLRLADVVFPAFLVASGAALALGRRRRPLRSIVIRAARLAAVGVALVALRYTTWHITTGVLQFIAAAWLIGALAQRVRPSRRLLVAGGLIALSIALHALPLTAPHVRGWGPHGIDEMVDSAIIGSRSDQGLIGMLSGAALVILSSTIAGWALVVSDLRRRTGRLVAAAAVSAVAGLALEASGVTVVKRLWSPSFVLLALAWSLAAWAVLEVVVSHDAVRRILAPVVALSRNAIAAYVVLILLVAFLPGSIGDATVRALEPHIGATAGSLAFSALVTMALAAAATAMSRHDVVIKV